MSDPILVLDNVSKTFRRSGGSPVKAVSNVSLSVGRGETVALVGESGSGKSTLGRIALGLLAPDSGRVVLEGQALGELSPEAFRRARVAMQPIFQDASSSLNPRRSARELMEQACFQCHSNLVEYPWYSDIAPMSWAVQSHINGGRSEVNYSEFATDPGNADETIEVLQDGSMPPAYFTRFGRNPEAILSDAELKQLIAGLQATPGLAGEDKSEYGADED